MLFLGFAVDRRRRRTEAARQKEIIPAATAASASRLQRFMQFVHIMVRIVAKQTIYAKYELQLVVGDAKIERPDDVLSRKLLRVGIESLNDREKRNFVGVPF